MVPDLVLTVAQMRAAEAALIDAGSSVDALMQVAGRGAAQWVWRVAAGRAVTVLCGPGNNGGDGYVIAEAIRERGGRVTVIAASEPKTEAATNARALYGGPVLSSDAIIRGDVFVDCLFGSGLTRPLSAEDERLLFQLAASHSLCIAIDVPSGVESDTGLNLNAMLPIYDLTIALGAWKPAHFLMPACADMGHLRLVDIGAGPVPNAARLLSRPRLAAPSASAHKYQRGLLGVVAGDMPGAAILAACSAQGAGAGYVKLLGFVQTPLPPDLVADPQLLHASLADPRWTALLIGPGLGRDKGSREALEEGLSRQVAAVLDADALVLLTPDMLKDCHQPLVATPHAGEMARLQAAFGLQQEGSKADQARALAGASGMVIVAKGPDTVIASPEGWLVYAPRASAWLSTAGTGDVLAGAIASRLATGTSAFKAACEGLWLHGEAARLAGPAFSAGELAECMSTAYAACL